MPRWRRPGRLQRKGLRSRGRRSAQSGRQIGPRRQADQGDDRALHQKCGAGRPVDWGVSAVLEETTRLVQDTVAFIDRVAGNIVSEAHSIDQVSEGVDQISSVVQTNSATAEESAAASEELLGAGSAAKGADRGIHLPQGRYRYCSASAVTRWDLPP